MKAHLEPEDIGLMEEAATNLRNKLLIRVLFYVGCRVSEALGIEVKHIDSQDGTVTIMHLKFHTKIECSHCHARLGRSHEYCPKCGTPVTSTVRKEQKNLRQRILPIDIETLDMLKEHMRQGGPVMRNGKRLIFGINRHRAWQIIKECSEQAGLPKLVNPETGKIHNVSPHRIRDCFAVNAIKKDNSGDGLRLLQEHLGHQSFNTTARYRKVAGDELREWYDKLWPKDKS